MEEKLSNWEEGLIESEKPLSPRHRRLALLAAQGMTNKKIAEDLGYSESRVSVLLGHSKIREEIQRNQERQWEEGIGQRLKALADVAVNTLVEILFDRTGRVRPSQKLEAAKFIIEKIDGKPVTKIEGGENLLSVLMDRLDSLKGAGRNNVPAAPAAERTPESQSQPSAPRDDEERAIDLWFEEFDRQSSN